MDEELYANKILLCRPISSNKLELICKHLIETAGEGGTWRPPSNKGGLMDNRCLVAVTLVKVVIFYQLILVKIKNAF